MDEKQAIEGLHNSEPNIILESSVWLVENYEKTNDKSCYGIACEMLQTASRENVECLQYIDSNVVKKLGFKAQLFVSLIKESPDEIKAKAKSSLVYLVENSYDIKNRDTDMAAQIYSALEELGDAELLEKGKKILA